MLYVTTSEFQHLTKNFCQFLQCAVVDMPMILVDEVEPWFMQIFASAVFIKIHGVKILLVMFSISAYLSQ